MKKIFVIFGILVVAIMLLTTFTGVALAQDDPDPAATPIESDIEEAQSYYERGFELYEQGEYELAIEDFDRAIELDPEHAQAYNNRGFVYYALGDYEQALTDFNHS